MSRLLSVFPSVFLVAVTGCTTLAPEGILQRLGVPLEHPRCNPRGTHLHQSPHRYYQAPCKLPTRPTIGPPFAFISPGKPTPPHRGTSAPCSQIGCYATPSLPTAQTSSCGGYTGAQHPTRWAIALVSLSRVEIREIQSVIDSEKEKEQNRSLPQIPENQK